MQTLRPDPTFYATPRAAMQAPAEELAYVVRVNPSGDGRPDAICVVDVDPTSRAYGTIVGEVGEFLAEPLWCVRNATNWRDHAHVRRSLCCSRDGRRWQRVGGHGPWVENGRPGSIDYGYACFTASGQLEHGGKCYIPYLAVPDKQHWFAKPSPPAPSPIVPKADFEAAERDWLSLGQALGRYPRHARSVGVLVLREDGWAELKPSDEYGLVYTRQFVFEGDALRINAECDGGYVVVEALDPFMEPYPGFSAEECVPVFSDDPDRVWHDVRWRGETDLRQLWNKPCRLRFHLRQASLYAFQFVATA